MLPGVANPVPAEEAMRPVQFSLSGVVELIRLPLARGAPLESRAGCWILGGLMKTGQLTSSAIQP